MTAVKLEANFASFPEVSHDGAKDFAAEVCPDFLDDRLKLRDHCGLMSEDLRLHTPRSSNRGVINLGCKGATDSPLALRSPARETLPPRTPGFPQCSGVRRRPVATTTDTAQTSVQSILP